MSCLTPKPTTAIMEDYLKVIFEIGLEKKAVRVRDIAAKLKVKMPTVTGMLKKLNQQELVRYEKYEYVELKPQGLEIATEMHRRHQVLQIFLIDILDVPEEVAEKEACGMEHVLSRATLARLNRFMGAARADRNNQGIGLTRNVKPEPANNGPDTVLNPTNIADGVSRPE